MRIYVENTSRYDAGVKVDGRSGDSFLTPTLEERGRKHWDKLHSRRMTPTELEEWEKEIPAFGCDCAAKYVDIKKANPPRFNDWGTWTWEVHNAVNASLGKSFFEWSDFCLTHQAIDCPTQDQGE